MTKFIIAHRATTSWVVKLISFFVIAVAIWFALTALTGNGANDEQSFVISSGQGVNEISKNLDEIGVKMKLGYGWPYIMLIDGCHGITINREDKGVWFLNYTSEYKEKFMDFWEKSEKI